MQKGSLRVKEEGRPHQRGTLTRGAPTSEGHPHQRGTPQQRDTTHHRGTPTRGVPPPEGHPHQRDTHVRGARPTREAPPTTGDAMLSLGLDSNLSWRKVVHACQGGSWGS